MPIIEIYRARIDPANVDRLMEIRAQAVAEFQEQAPELLQADLVRLEDDVWLDVLVWSAPVDEQRISQAAAAAPKSVEMHALIADVLGHDRGEIVHSTGSAWATARHDLTALDQLLPHPVYAWMSWVQILNPTADRLHSLRDLRTISLELARDKRRRRRC
jgi:hypothetical protein